MRFRTNKAQRQVADRIYAAGGKLHSDLMAMIELRHLMWMGRNNSLPTTSNKERNAGAPARYGNIYNFNGWEGMDDERMGAYQK